MAVGVSDMAPFRGRSLDGRCGFEVVGSDG